MTVAGSEAGCKSVRVSQELWISEYILVSLKIFSKGDHEYEKRHSKGRR